MCTYQLHACTTHLVVKSAVLPLQKFLYGSSHLKDDSDIRWHSASCQKMYIDCYAATKAHWLTLSHPLAEADDRPQTEAQCATAAEAAAQEPPHIHWQRLPQAAVYAADTGFKFFWCHLKKCTFKHNLIPWYETFLSWWPGLFLNMLLPRYNRSFVMLIRQKLGFTLHAAEYWDAWQEQNWVSCAGWWF